MKKTILLLTSAMVAASVGCSAAPVSGGGRSAISAVTARSDKAYRLREIEVPADTSGLLSICPTETGWFIAAGGLGDAPVFLTADSGFTEFKEVQIPFDVENSRIAPVLCSWSGTVWMAVTVISGDGDIKAASDAEYSHFLYELDSRGSVISRKELTDLGETEIYSLAYADGRLFAVADAMYAINTDSGEVAENSRVMSSALGTASDGSLIYCSPDGSDSAIELCGNRLSLREYGAPVTNISAGGGYDAVFATDTTICGISGNTVTELAASVSLGLQSRSIHALFRTLAIEKFSRNIDE